MIVSAQYEVRRIFTGDEVPNLIDFYKLQQEWMEKFGLVKEVYRFASADDMLKMCQYIDQHKLLLWRRQPDFSIRPVRRTNIICEDWAIEREYLDEAISELLESA